MANVITTVIKLVTDGAERSVKSFRQSVAEADGTVNKFRAGASSAMASIGVSAGTLAVAGGAALATFGAKAVGAFQETALEAGKLADATGLTVEQASRLREVAGDIGVSGETVTSVIRKMSVELGKGNPLLEQYGIALQTGADGSADLNATLVDTIRKIGQIEDPTERAAAAQAAFGRGYTEAAELIFGSADALQQKLAEVSDQKVINEDELKRARDFRESMDNLQDALEDIQLVAGEALVPLVSDIADLIVGANDARQALEGMIPGDVGLGDISRGAVPLFVDAVKDLKDAFDGGSESGGLFRSVIQGMLPEINEAGNIVGELGEEVEELGPRWSASTIPLEAASGAFAEMQSEADRARAALGEVEEQADETASTLQDKLVEAINAVAEAVDERFSQFEENLDIQDLLDDITEQFAEVAEAQTKITEDGDEGVRNYNRSVRDLKRQLAELLGEIDGIPPDKKVAILTEIERAGVDELYRILGDLSRGVTIPVVMAQSGPGFDSANVSFNPSAGTITPVINPVQSAIPGGSFSTVDARTIINNYPVGSTPTTQYIDGVTDTRRNGLRTYY